MPAMHDTPKPVRILFVCTGNICRSPTADGIMRDMVAKSPLAGAVEIDSCGLSGYHAGEKADPRSRAMAAERGYHLDNLRARQITAEDFAEFDYILAMDDGHFRDMRQQCPAQYRDKIELFLDYHPDRRGQSVPDPYYGGASGFAQVFDMIEESCAALLQKLLGDQPAPTTEK